MLCDPLLNVRRVGLEHNLSAFVIDDFCALVSCGMEGQGRLIGRTDTRAGNDRKYECTRREAFSIDYDSFAGVPNRYILVPVFLGVATAVISDDVVGKCVTDTKNETEADERQPQNRA